ncbi:DUF4376 domain-containing protein [Escherichia coli]|uniref:DUF4376 domain-containing protein n=1 Tax=Escherichia coli TaxID=562 RepID=UPI00338F6DFE
MKIEKIINPVWGNPEHTVINGMVKFLENNEALPFTATPEDTELHGREVFEACIRGEAGRIGDYTPELTVDMARVMKNSEINAWRNEMENMEYVFEHNGRKWDYGKQTLERLEPSLSSAKAGRLPETFFWTDAENNDVPMDAETLIALSAAAELAMFTKGLEIHVRQRAMKKEVEALEDADAILAYKVGMAGDG